MIGLSFKKILRRCLVRKLRANPSRDLSPAFDRVGPTSADIVRNSKHLIERDEVGVSFNVLLYARTLHRRVI